MFAAHLKAGAKRWATEFKCNQAFIPGTFQVKKS